MTEYRNTLPGRYAGLALPLVYVSLAGWLADPFFPTRRPRPRRLGTDGGGLSLVLIVGLLATLGYQLYRYYDVETRERRTNEDFHRIVALVERQGLPVVLDGSIKRTSGEGSGPSAVLMGLLEWRGVDVKRESDPRELRDYLMAITWPVVVIVSEDTLGSELGGDPGDTAPPSLRLDPIAHVAPQSDTPGWAVAPITPAGR
jgi:hypothetical protein